ncbi:MAG: hypothetical protein AAFV33_23675, partial [Chloroflexota bacterium]
MTSEYQQGDTQPQPFKRQPAARRSGGPGLMLPLVAFLFTVLLALVLVTVALLLPPFNLLERITGVQYAMLDATNNAARTPDQTLTLILSPE